MNYSRVSAAGRHPMGAYVLAGGASRRMGRDKALLLAEGEPLLVRQARLLASLPAEPIVVAPPGRYESLGIRTISDRRENCGPLAGIEAALLHSNAEWNLVLACDHPYLTGEWLRELVSAAIEASSDVRCVCTADNPLLAVWRNTALPEVQSALNAAQLRLRDLLIPLNALKLIPPDPQILANWNRPEDLLENSSEGKANLGS